MNGQRIRQLLAGALTLAFVAAGSAGGTATPVLADPQPPPMLAGAAKVNITPFTLTSQLSTCRSDPACPYHSVVSLSNPEASNPDGLPGGLFQTIGQEMAGPAASTEWIGPGGMWGEPFLDANSNGRYDAGEPFTDDPANSSPVVGAGHPSTLGDPVSSPAKWDGVYIAGYGDNRVALGALDPIWARVLFLRDARTDTSVAWVSLDLLGYFSDFAGRIEARLPQSLGVDHIILTHTHDHEAPDTHVGIWGQDIVHDGTYPRYEIYIEAKIAQAIAEAAGNLQPARFRFGAIRSGETFVTPRGNSEQLDGMQSRNSCRTPWFFDDELRVMQVKGTGGGTIATLLNWGTHVESMNGRNQYLSSDFVHTARTTVEQKLGGVALHTPGAQGAAEIVGDSCTSRWHRDTFDGETFPVDPDGGEPLAFRNPYDNRVPRDRTYAIGRVVGAAALAALRGEPLDPPNAPFEFHGPRLLCFPVNNEGLAALAAAGVIDKPLVNTQCPTEAGAPPERAKTTLYAFRIGSGSFLTMPGEIAPELYYGISQINRSTFNPATPGYDYVSPNPDALACSARSHHGAVQPGAHTDRPFEPDIREAQKARFGARVNFLIGYTPDLLGYVVPGYDYYWLGGPGGFGLPVDQIADPCRDIPPDLAFPSATFGSHYQETNSGGSMLGPAVACELARLLDDPFGEARGLADGATEGACFEWDVANATGRPPDRAFAEPGCPVPSPEACLIRHY